MSNQSRLLSAVESVANVVVGYVVAVAAQVVVFPLFGIAVEMGTNMKIGAVFTFVSLLRSYALRRVFAGISTKRRVA